MSNVTSLSLFFTLATLTLFFFSLRDWILHPSSLSNWSTRDLILKQHWSFYDKDSFAFLRIRRAFPTRCEYWFHCFRQRSFWFHFTSFHRLLRLLCWPLIIFLRFLLELKARTTLGNNKTSSKGKFTSRWRLVPWNITILVWTNLQKIFLKCKTFFVIMNCLTDILGDLLFYGFIFVKKSI